MRLTTYELAEGGIPYVTVKDEQDALQKLAAYENAEEQGLLVRLPCSKVRHGHWESLYWAFDYYRCSECGFEQRLEEFPYCPNCGAKMDESEDEK